MENTIKNIKHFTSDADPQIGANPRHQPNQGQYVFWRVNLEELFAIDLSYPGIKKALNMAFNDSKRYVPVDTGLTKRSMTMKELNEYMVEIFFDPKKIIGQKRKGVIIKENYTVYIAESPKRFNWISICMYHFYTTLFAEVKKLEQKNKNQQQKAGRQGKFITLAGALSFMKQFKEDYKAKKEEAKLLKEEQREKRRLKEEAIREKKRLRRIKNESLRDLEDQEDE